MEMGRARRYGVSWSPPDPSSISRRFFSSKLMPKPLGMPGEVLFSRKDGEVDGVAKVGFQSEFSAVPCADALCTPSCVSI